MKNAQQAYDRAQQLLKTQAGTQRALDDAEAALRTAQARLNSAQTRLARRKVFSPVAGTVEQVYYRVGEMVPAGRPVVALLPPGNVKLRFFVNEAVLPKLKLGDAVNISCDGCDERADRQDQLHRPHLGVHAAGDLQPGGALEARVPDRSAAGAAGAAARRPAGQRRACRSRSKAP